MRLFIALLTLALFSCNEAPHHPDPVKGSPEQQHLQQVAQNYAQAVNATANDLEIQTIRNKYEQQLTAYLRDTLKGQLQGAEVEVSDFEAGNPSSFSATMRDAACVYSFSKSFLDAATAQKDSVYNYFSQRHLFEDIKVNLKFLGQVKTVYPVKEGRAFEISAVIEP